MTEMRLNNVQRDPTRLYTNKAEIYANSRPDYHPEAFSAFQEITRLSRQSLVLDVGSGTGLMTRHLLRTYDTVFAVEPNPRMRFVAENDPYLSGHPGFHSLDACAEHIPLVDHSADLIAVGQAIHWFKPEAALKEFQRVAKPQAWLLLAHIQSLDNVFNQALGEIFTEDNGCLPQDQHPPSNLVPDSYYFTDGQFKSLHFPHISEESWERFIGGIASAAYAPNREHPLYDKFVQAARGIFERFSTNNVIRWEIATEISFGHLAGSGKSVHPHTAGQAP
jgi:SAM-dependent methyltransferase